VEAPEPAALARKARTLLRRSPAGVLSTWSTAMPGFPFGSLAPFVLTHEGRPLLYLSRLAEHTRNLAAQPRACLTVLEATAGDPQAVGRASLLAEAHQAAEVEHAALAARYFALLPEGREYEQLGDFAFWWLEPVRVRWIGGFGEIAWIEREQWLLETPEWQHGEAGIVTHMNDDHRDALEQMCRALIGDEPRDTAMVACDPEGFHVRNAGAVHWIPFAHACATANDVRLEMVRLSRSAREAGSRSC
jgi:putative heme iron utilization protein